MSADDGQPGIETSRDSLMLFDWESGIAESADAEQQPRFADQPPLRLVRPKDGPTISVILVTRRTRGELSEGLPSLVLTCSQMGAELLVIGPSNAASRAASRHVRFVVAPADATICQLRALAMELATGDVVLILDDETALSKGGIERLRAWGRRADGRGGDEIERGVRAEIDWQAYLNRAGSPLS